MKTDLYTAPGLFGVVGRTQSGYTVLAIPPGMDSLLKNQAGSSIAVDEAAKIMYCCGVFAALHGSDEIMRACEGYPPSKGLAAAQERGASCEN